MANLAIEAESRRLLWIWPSSHASPRLGCVIPSPPTGTSTARRPALLPAIEELEKEEEERGAKARRSSALHRDATGEGRHAPPAARGPASAQEPAGARRRGLRRKSSRGAIAGRSVVTPPA